MNRQHIAVAITTVALASVTGCGKNEKTAGTENGIPSIITEKKVDVEKLFNNPSYVSVALDKAGIASIEKGFSTIEPYVDVTDTEDGAKSAKENAIHVLNISNASANQASPIQQQSPGLAEACESIEECVEAMLAAVREPTGNAVQAASKRINAFPKPARGDRKEARKANAAALEALNSGKTDQAIFLFGEAIKHDGSDVEILSNFGVALVRSGNGIAAVNALIAALLIDPNRTSSWVPLGEAYELTGNRQNAEAALLLGYRFSGNQEKTLAYFIAKAENAERPLLKSTFATAVKQIASSKEPNPGDQPLHSQPLPGVAVVMPPAAVQDPAVIRRNEDKPCFVGTNFRPEQCNGVQVNGVGRYSGFMPSGASGYLKIAIDRQNYYLSPVPKIPNAIEGQLIKFTAVTNKDPKYLENATFEVVPFVGDKAQELARDAFVIARECASAAKENPRDLFRGDINMPHAVWMDPADHKNAIVISPNIGKYDLIYRCAIQDGKVLAIQAHRGKFTDATYKWEDIESAKTALKDTYEKEEAESQLKFREKRDALLEVESKDPAMRSAIQLQVAMFRAQTSLFRDNPELAKSAQISSCHERIKSSLGSLQPSEQKIAVIRDCASRTVDLCLNTGRPETAACNTLLSQIAKF